MEEQKPAPSGWKGFFKLLGICALIGLIIIFVRCTYYVLTMDPPSPLDYDAVMRNPSIFNGEAAALNGEIADIVTVSPSADTKYSFFTVREHGNPGHLWLVYGNVKPSDYQKMQEGMDLNVTGVCVGSMPLTRFGKEIYYPTIYFYSYEYGYTFTPEVTP